MTLKPRWDSKSVGEYERSRKPKVEDDDDIQDYKKPWVGLTHKEKSELWEISRATLPRYATFASLVEAKLKEKNT